MTESLVCLNRWLYTVESHKGFCELAALSLHTYNPHYAKAPPPLFIHPLPDPKMGTYGVVNGIALILLERRGIIALSVCPPREGGRAKNH